MCKGISNDNNLDLKTKKIPKNVNEWMKNTLRWKEKISYAVVVVVYVILIWRFASLSQINILRQTINKKNWQINSLQDKLCVSY